MIKFCKVVKLDSGKIKENNIYVFQNVCRIRERDGEVENSRELDIYTNTKYYFIVSRQGYECFYLFSSMRKHFDIGEPSIV